MLVRSPMTWARWAAMLLACPTTNTS